MKCSSCGSFIKDSASFCQSCGAEINHEEPKLRFSRPPEKYTGPKKLYRDRSDRYIAGVCGGLGEYFDVDSDLIRVFFVFFTFAGGAGILLYLIMILFIPESPLDPWSE